MTQLYQAGAQAPRDRNRAEDREDLQGPPHTLPPTDLQRGPGGTGLRGHLKQSLPRLQDCKSSRLPGVGPGVSWLRRTFGE